MRKNKRISAREQRQLIQLVICGSVFVLFVAVKLLLPGKVAAFNERLSGALERSVDVQAVFSAIGQTFAGEETADGVYRAVFGPETHEEAEEILLPESAAALEELHMYRKEPAPEEPQGETEQSGVSQLSYVLYSQENLPENVIMEQELLNFDYCSPVVGTISSEFGYREHPDAGEERFHYGIDIAADTGTEIRSFADGTVTAVGESSSYGKYCILSHSGSYRTLYAHCSKITVGSGATVKRGMPIAEVGETGMATGPHLHFEVQKGSVYLNPVYYLTAL